MHSLLHHSFHSFDLFSSYDLACKKVLSFKIILAHILKGTVEEFSTLPIDTILSCIEGTPEISKHTVHQDMITALNNEDSSILEGTRYYDMKFYCYLPGQDKRVKLIINIEAQDDYYVGYPLIKRALYYCARMLSSQLGREFKGEHYEDIKKVYSIWIIQQAPKKKQNSITRYGIEEDCILQQARLKRQDYDMMQVIMLYLPKEGVESKQELLRLLSVILSKERSAKEKIEILEKEYRIKMKEEDKKEVENMCNLSQGVHRDGIKKGIMIGRQEGRQEGLQDGILIGKESTLLASIQSIMKNLNMDMYKAMEVLNIPKDQQEKYMTLLSHN